MSGQKYGDFITQLSITAAAFNAADLDKIVFEKEDIIESVPDESLDVRKARITMFVRDIGGGDIADAVERIVRGITERVERLSFPEKASERGAMPIDWLPHLMEATKRYMYGLKDDGVRAWLLIYRGLILVLPRNKSRQIIEVSPTALTRFTEEWNLVLLDGEVITQKIRNDEASVVFIASSCMVYDNMSVLDRSAESRWRLADRIVRKLPRLDQFFFVRCKHVWMSATDFASTVKEITKNNLLHWRENSGGIVAMVTPFDGYLVYERDAVYAKPGTIFKLKPFKNTVDVRLEDNVDAEGRNNLRFMLNVGFDGANDNQPPWKTRTIGFIPKPKGKFIDSKGRFRDEVYECEYNPNTSSWDIIRPRPDKRGSPNSVKVYFDSQNQLNSIYCRDRNVFFRFLIDREIGTIAVVRPTINVAAEIRSSSPRTMIT